MEDRKWEDLNEDCLVNIFGRLDLESLLLDVPLVCKQWHRATLNPLSWRNLVFPVDITGSRLADAFGVRVWRPSIYDRISELIKLVVGRSQGCAEMIVLPNYTTKEGLIFVSEMCPTLKALALPSVDYRYRARAEFAKYFDYDYNACVGGVGYAIPELLVKWKSLEVLKLGRFSPMVRIVDQIGLHCNNFVELSVTNARIDQEIASAIVSNLATIKRLILDKANLEKVNLELILRGCKELELLYVLDCVGFNEDDEEILMTASRIKDFRCEGSKTKVSYYSSDSSGFYEDLSNEYYDYAWGDEYEDYIEYCDY